jgi:hypothetical protein
MLNRNEYTSLEAAQWDMSCNNELHTSDGYSTNRQHSPRLRSHQNTRTCNYNLTHMKVTYHTMHHKTVFTKAETLITEHRVLLKTLIVITLTKKLFNVYGSQQFSTVFFKSLQLVHLHTIFLKRFILILFSHLCLGPPNGLLPSGCPTKILYAFQMSCPTQLTLPDFTTPTMFGDKHKL